MYTVYKIDTYHIQNNSHKIDRDESWIERKDKSFMTEDEAKDHIRAMSLIHTNLVTFFTSGMKLVDLDERERITEEFCFNNPKYLRYRRYFIGRVPKKEIKKALKDDGIMIKFL